MGTSGLDKIAILEGGDGIDPGGTAELRQNNSCELGFGIYAPLLIYASNYDSQGNLWKT